MAGYRNLIFYKKAQEVVKLIDNMVKSWPKSMQAQEISRQLFRAATSVGANIAEGHGRHQGREYIHYLIISQGSANEIDHWLHTAADCNLSEKSRTQELINLNNEVRKMLTSTIRTLRRKQGPRKINDSVSPYTPSPYPLEEL